MSVFEIRDPIAARKYVASGLCLMRGGKLGGEAVYSALVWAHRMASDGNPLPAVGFLADVGRSAISSERDRTSRGELLGIDSTITRRYDDYVIGKLRSDLSFEKAADAAAYYQDEDREKAIVYLISRIAERAKIGGAMLSPAVTKSLLKIDPDEVLREAWENVEQDGFGDQLLNHWRRLIAQIRNTGDLLSRKEIFALQRGTALVAFGQQFALDQTLDAAELIWARLPRQKVRPRRGRREVATQILDDDAYPVGGFTSISNRGSVESLLHSQLAYIEEDNRPDLFDVKYLRDELLYYSRDENQFWRRRVRFVLVLNSELTAARFKDESAPFQRIILLLGFYKALADKLGEWLSEDAVGFEFVFLSEGPGFPLADEREMVETLFGKEIDFGPMPRSRTEFQQSGSVGGRGFGPQRLPCAGCRHASSLVVERSRHHFASYTSAANAYIAAGRRWQR